jgi:hypothetical protein
LPGRPHSSTRLPSSASAGVVRTHGPATFPLTGPGSASGLVPIENSRDAARDCGLHATPVHFRGFRRTASDRSVTWPPSLQHQVPGFRFPPASTAILPSRRPFPSRVPGSAPGHVPICDSRDAARDCGLHATPVLFRGLRRTASDRSVAWPPSLQHQAPGFRLHRRRHGLSSGDLSPRGFRVRLRATSRFVTAGTLRVTVVCTPPLSSFHGFRRTAPGQVRRLAAFPPAPGSRVPPSTGVDDSVLPPRSNLSPHGSGFGLRATSRFVTAGTLRVTVVCTPPLSTLRGFRCAALDSSATWPPSTPAPGVPMFPPTSGV